MNSENQQLEKLLDRLDAGVSLASIEAEFGAELQDYLEVIEFLRAQQSTHQPNPENLKQALLQGDLLTPEISDDWGSFRFFKVRLSHWQTWGGVGVSMFGVVVLAASWWNPPQTVVTPEAEIVGQKSIPTESLAVADSANFSTEVMPMAARSYMAEPAVGEDPETEAWLQAWQSDFESEMNEFNQAKATLEPTYADPLFSRVTPSQS